MESKNNIRIIDFEVMYKISFSTIINVLTLHGYEVNSMEPSTIIDDNMKKIIIKEFNLDNSINSNDVIKKLSEKYIVKTENKKNNITEKNSIESSIVEKIDTEYSKLTGVKFTNQKIDLSQFNKPIQKRTRIPNTAIVQKINEKSSQMNTTIAIGNLLFFDYKINHFGIVEDIIAENNYIINKVKIFKENIEINRNLNDGEIVFFNFKYDKSSRYKYFVDGVNSIENFEIERFNTFIENISSENLKNILERIPVSILERLFQSTRSTLLEKLLKVESDFVWKSIVKRKDEILIEKYILKRLNKLDDATKLNYLKAAFHLKLLQNIIENWNSINKNSYSSLLNITKSNSFNEVNLSKKFIDNLKLVDLNFEDLLTFYKLSKDKSLKNKLIKSFSFNQHRFIDDLNFLLEDFNLDEKDLTQIKNLLKEELEILSFNKIFEVFSKFSKNKIIETENDFLFLVSEKKLNYENLLNLISTISNKCDANLFSKIISNSDLSSSSEYKILELIESCPKKNLLIEIIISLGLKDSDGEINCYTLFNILGKNLSKEINKYILKEYYRELTNKNELELFEYAIKYESKTAQKYCFKKITLGTSYNLSSDNDLWILINRLNKLVIPTDIQAENIPISEFLDFLASESKCILSIGLKDFLNEHSGAAQCLIVKNLIYKHYTKKISKVELLKIFNSFKWTEISALLVIEFIKESNYSDRFLAQKLDLVFKNHFQELINIGYIDSRTFYNNYEIKNIVNKCDGRKYYDGKRWGQNRWYFEKGIVSIKKSKYSSEVKDIYCEGRFWKSEDAWNGTTNTNTQKKIDFYWCKGSYCASRNDTKDLEIPFYKWTISEIATALEITVDKLAFSYLAGWVNRMNQILEHLFCRECNHVLRPFPFVPKSLGYYAVPVFQCVNNLCSKYESKIRFTHCLNSKCESHMKNEPLDSRDCESCNPSNPNHTGLKCNFCGQPCPSCSGGYKPIIVQNN